MFITVVTVGGGRAFAVFAYDIFAPITATAVPGVAYFSLETAPVIIADTAWHTLDRVVVHSVCCAVDTVVVVRSGTAKTASVTWSDVGVASRSGPVAVADTVSVLVP